MTTNVDSNISIMEMAQVMAQCDDFVICGHGSPDGDCLGSQLTLYHALKALGKNVTCVLAKDEPLSPLFSFMPGIDSMVAAKDYQGPAKTFVAVDVSVRERLGDAAGLLDRCVQSFTVDHHANNGPITTYEIDDPDSPSASLLVWDLVCALMEAPPEESALCAYTGLLTDTGGFCYQNTSAKALSAATSLVSYGVDPSFVASQVFQNRTEASLELERIVLERLTTFADGKGVISWITQEDLQRFDAKKYDTEPLIDSIRSLMGIRVACLLREQDGIIRGSLRAKDATDVASLARTLEGGGHRAAAGFTLRIPMDEAIPFMIHKIDHLLEA